MVRGLQGRVHAGRSALLLSADHHRLRQPLSHCLRGALYYQGSLRLSGVRGAFKEFGLPKAIRTDNGVPFASPNALFNLSKLSVWWLRLGIEIERIKPGHPQQNGRHERMHLTLKLETTKPAGKNFLQQQAKFDDFIDCFNNERPHQALDMRTRPSAIAPSTRPYRGLPDLDYPFHDKTVTVTTCGRICFNRQKDQSQPVVFAGQNVGIKQVERGYLARHLHALRSRLFRPRDLQARSRCQSLRTESVADVQP